MAYGKAWAIGPFSKHRAPALEPSDAAEFWCPVTGRSVRWESSNVYNPATVVKDGSVHLFYRADGHAKTDAEGRRYYTCRIGHGWSNDGVHFSRGSAPVLYPDRDEYLPYTWDRGLWDPHIVEDEDGTYYLYYNTDNGHTHRRHVATSRDLVQWRLHGSIFAQFRGADYSAINGLVIWRPEGERKIAAKIDGRYWMYYDHHAKVAVSHNLIDWEPLDTQIWEPQYRPGFFDSASGEPGTALLTEQGIVFVYNAQNHPDVGSPRPEAKNWVWTLGQALLDSKDPTRLIDRLDEPFLTAELPWEIEGGPTHDGLVRFRDGWMLYYGASDHVVGVATTRIVDSGDKS